MFSAKAREHSARVDGRATARHLHGKIERAARCLTVKVPAEGTRASRRWPHSQPWVAACLPRPAGVGYISSILAASCLVIYRETGCPWLRPRVSLSVYSGPYADTPRLGREPLFLVHGRRPQLALPVAHFVPPPPRGRLSAPDLHSPGLAHSPPTRPPRSLVLDITYARIGTDAGVERARILCPACMMPV